MPISRKQLLYAMLGALALAACSGVLALLISDSDAVWRIAGTCLTAALAAAIMMPMSAWADKPMTRTAGLTGMCIAVVELGLASLLIWGQFFSSSTREFLAMSVAIIGGCGLTSVWFLKQINCDGWRRTAQVGAAGCVFAALLFWCAAY